MSNDGDNQGPSTSDYQGTLQNDNQSTPTRPTPLRRSIEAPVHLPQKEISRVAIKLPPFWKPNVVLWFLQIESQFVTGGIVSEDTKFHYVLGAIESDVLNQVSDFLISLPRENKYTLLKKKLIDEFSESEARKARKLLTEVELGDRKPSTLLREMRQLAGTDLSEQFLKNMFLRNLPAHASAILTCSEGTLESVANMADKILDATPGEHRTFQVDTNPKDKRIQELEKQVESLTHRLEIFTLHHNSSRSRSSNSRGSARSQSRSRSARFPTCWYHYKYGAQAKRCDKPCDFGNPTPTTHSEN